MRRFCLAAALAAASDAALAQPAGRTPDADAETRLSGAVQLESAYTYADPDHWSKLRLWGTVRAGGVLGPSMKWRASVEGLLDAAYDVESAFYPAPVRDAHRRSVRLGETYLDWSAGDWEFRFGRQHIVWGEMVTLFVADVVSARDLREFVLPEFERIRIPQWAARAEWFKDDAHVELVWIPYPSFDFIGKPGSDFYPYPIPTPGFVPEIAGEVKPSRKLSHTNYGVRLSTLVAGWDLSAFWYGSLDAAPTFHRRLRLEPVPVATFEPRHERIAQWGGTFSKDFEGIVVKGEAVYSRGRKFNVVRTADEDGLVELATVDWIVGADFTPADDWRVNAQFFQRYYVDHDPDIVFSRRESGASVLVNRRFGGRWEVETLVASSLNRSDWMVRPAVIWNAGKNWRVKAGLDVFGGRPIGLFGRFDQQDRVYAELRYSF